MQTAASTLFFVQVRPPLCRRWTTHAVAGSPDVAARKGAEGWRVPVQMTGAELRIVSDADLEREGGIVAVAEAVASLHAQALRACRWLPVADEVVGPRQRS